MRRATAATLLLALLAPAARAEEPAPEERAFVETVVPDGPFVAGEAIRLVLRVGYDRDWFEARAVPLFHRTLDVPLQADAPWLRRVRDAVAAPEPPRPAGEAVATIALNGEAAPLRCVADVERGGRTFAVLEAARTWRATRPGAVALAAPTLRFAHATRFREDLLGERTAEDPRDVLLRGTPRTLEVRPLPVDGRPPGFGGAVGRYTVRAQADRPEAAVGEVLKVRLTIEGEGNLDLLPPPSPGELAGFHVYGTLDEPGPGRRTLTYDVAPLDEDVRAVPAIPFPYYDPGPPGAWRVARTDPIPLRVRAGKAAPPAAGTPASDGAPDGAATPGALPAIVALAALLAGAAFVAARVRRRRRAAALEAGTRRSREAEAAFRAQATRPGADLADAFAGVLAARLDCPPAAVVSPDLAARLVASGVPADLAGRAARTLEALVAARYGGAPADPAAAAAVVAEIAGSGSGPLRGEAAARG